MFALSPPSREAEAGQGLVEYALILVLIAVVAIVSLAFFGHTVSGMLEHDRDQRGERRLITVPACNGILTST